MGVNSTRGMRVPDANNRVVYVRKWILGRVDRSSESVIPARSEEGVGPTDTEITCCKPARHIESMTSALKRSIRSDFSCIYRGCVLNRSDAKCIIGL